MRGRIVDGFTFAGEADVLEIRLNELDPYVDRFVLVEAAVTHAGATKPLTWHDQLRHEARFAPFADKVLDINLATLPHTDQWSAELYQRDAIAWGFYDLGVGPDDAVLVSDVDEIPRGSLVAELAAQIPFLSRPAIWSLRNTTYYYRLNWRTPDWHINKWPVLASGADVASFPSLCRMRENPANAIVVGAGIPNYGGWHFSYLGQMDAVGRKMASISEHGLFHGEVMTPDHVHRCITEGIDLLGRFTCNCVEIDDTFPAYVQANRDSLFLRGLVTLGQPASH